jgi:hypothetical protein
MGSASRKHLKRHAVGDGAATDLKADAPYS